MVRRLRKGDSHTISIEVARPPEDVWAVVGDPTRYPELSPETFRVRWLGGATSPSIGARFRGWNHRRLAVWPTTCRVDAHEPGRLLTFTPLTGGSLTQWTWQVEPGAAPDTSVLTETVLLNKDSPGAVFGFELFGMFDGDRLAALHENVTSSLARVKELVEAEA